MATKASEEKDIIYFPIDQGEQAKQAKPEYLLARPVYERIAGILKESLDKTIDSFSSDDACLDLDEHRAHNAILLDGGRGTGKSTILVNLSTYASTVPTERTLPDKSEAKLADFLLILKPVDPTLLENEDDLFLNIIVAALLRNKEVKDATQDYEKSKTFYTRLQALGNALEGTQKQKSEFGMDKLRAFIGNHSVSDEVHKLFYEALKITGKKLIVLPIDDVDTSLQHAFNNLEVVRRYLASPYVIPIISGDLDLFHEVIWRNFFEGIAANARTVEIDDATERSKKLALEYERKLLPVANRVEIPKVNSLFGEGVYLTVNHSPLKLQLSVVVRFFDILINRRVGGWFENGFVKIEYPSIRTLSQLLFSCRAELIKLNHLFEVGDDEYFMENIINHSVNEKKFSDDAKNIIFDFRRKFSDVFRISDYSKEVVVFHDAYIYWNDFVDPKFEICNSIFDTLLFQPLAHETSEFSSFCTNSYIYDQWRSYLLNRIDDVSWFERLPRKTLLSYPLPDKGLAIPRKLVVNNAAKGVIKSIFVFDKIYSFQNFGGLIFFGRLFEILVRSLFSKIKVGFMHEIIYYKPYFSINYFCGTKLVKFEKESTEESEGLDFADSFESSGVNDESVFGDSTESEIKKLELEIISWREQYGKGWDDVPNPLLIYRVMNKFFTQLSHSSLYGNKVGKNCDFREIAKLGLTGLNAFCAIVGSFDLDISEGDAVTDNFFDVDVFEFEGSDICGKYVFGNLFSEMDLDSFSNGYSEAIFKHPIAKFLRSYLDI